MHRFRGGTFTRYPGAARISRSIPPPAGAPSDWWTSVQTNIQDAEYELTWHDETPLQDVPAAWHAPNRAHNFRTYFTDRGIRSVPRVAADPSWEWDGVTGHRPRRPGVARGESGAPPQGNRIEYRRDGIVEWYVNDPKGLEQGFLLNAPPEELPAAREPALGVAPGLAGTPGARPFEPDRAAPAHLVLELAGDLSPIIGAEGQVIDFVTPEGRPALRYASLEVRDAIGKDVPAWMEGWNDAGSRGIRIVLDDRGAIYPLSVDPLATSPAWTAEGNQAGAYFGVSVATAGDVNGDGYSDVIVGATPYDNGETDEGRAFVYLGSASGLSASRGLDRRGRPGGAAVRLSPWRRRGT